MAEHSGRVQGYKVKCKRSHTLPQRLIPTSQKVTRAHFLLSFQNMSMYV